VTTGNLYGHLIFGMSSQFVTDTMVNGQWLLRNRRFVGVDEAKVREKSAKVAAKVWRRFQRL
jgi:cytosine/adenosine deaminase-related metal-dependent hydrolase